LCTHVHTWVNSNSRTKRMLSGVPQSFLHYPFSKLWKLSFAPLDMACKFASFFKDTMTLGANHDLMQLKIVRTVHISAQLCT
jgi:hypothetical protein